MIIFQACSVVISTICYDAGSVHMCVPCLFISAAWLQHRPLCYWEEDLGHRVPAPPITLYPLTPNCSSCVPSILPLSFSLFPDCLGLISELVISQIQISPVYIYVFQSFVLIFVHAPSPHVIISCWDFLVQH